jgi:two-component system NarL family response regulator
LALWPIHGAPEVCYNLPDEAEYESPSQLTIDAVPGSWVSYAYSGTRLTPRHVGAFVKSRATFHWLGCRLTCNKRLARKIISNTNEDGMKPTHSDKIRVMIADDHVTVLEGLAAIISRQPDMAVLAAASDGAEAVALWKKHRPDITLVDLRMPILDGVGAIEEIRRLDASARFIVLTTFDTDTDLLNAIKAGAKGYLLKDSGREELLDCIRTVHRGETCLPASLVQKLATSLHREALTAREVEVLQDLADGKSNKEISTALSISEATVKSHLGNIFRKLDVLSRTEAIATANKLGLIKL